MAAGSRIRIGLAALAVSAALVGAPPARADSGGIVAVVECTAKFPVIPGNGNLGTCDGTVTLSYAGTEGGTVLATGPFYANFVYSEPCLVAGQPDIFVSLANGHFWGYPGPHFIGGDFAWTRVGWTPLITFGPVTYDSRGAVGTATASFVPPGTFDANRSLLCGQGGAPLDIGVKITAVLAAP